VSPWESGSILAAARRKRKDAGKAPLPEYPQKRMRIWWCGVVALAVGVGLVAVEPAVAASPTEVLEAFYARANAVIRSVDPLGDLEQPRQAIRDLVNDVFDFRGAAAMALGPAWLSKTPEDQAEFVRLFRVFLERGFIGMIAQKASLTDGVKIDYLGESITKETAGVATTLQTRNGHELPVDYWFVRRGEGWKVQDVVIDGVSLVANYRAQFARVLGAFPYGEVIARMGGNPPDAQAPIGAPAHIGAPIPIVEAKPVAPAIPPIAQMTLTAQATSPAPSQAAAPAIFQPAAPPIAQPAAPQMPQVAVLPAQQPAAPPIPKPMAPSAAPTVTALATRTRQEIQLASVRRVEAPAARPRLPFSADESQLAGPYWVQVGAFQSVNAAGHMADRFRQEGATISQFWLSNVSGNRAGVLARVRLGPFANRSDALSKVRELTARGQTSFIAGARD
jgi:phospholipid transport system substrate-binding protein